MTSTENTEELELLRDSIAKLLERAGGVKRARDSRGNPALDHALWKEMAEAGILAVTASEEAGGLALGLPAAGVIALEMGRLTAPEPFVATTCLAIPLLEASNADNDLISALVSGEKTAGVALQERDTSGLATTLSTRFAGGQLTGSKSWAVACEGADMLLVSALAEDGPCLCLVEADATGVTRRAVRQTDGSFLYELSFSATPASGLAHGPKAGAAIEAALDRATALVAAELLGVCHASLALTLEFLRTREQFGKKIGSFQAIQHRAVDMHTACEVADAGIRDALRMVEGTPDATTRARHASRAKARACEAAALITRESIQMHGAVGYTDEFDIGLYLNRALALSAWLGNATYHRKRWFDLTGIEEQIA